MKAWAIFTTVAVALLWVVSLTRHDDDDNPSPQPSAPAPVVKRDPFNPIEDYDHIVVAELLNRPREELAARCDEKEQQILGKEKLRVEGKLAFHFSVTRYPVAYPIWRQAHYSAKRGMVLPPYLADDAYDATLALHLARYGDVEAARKIVDPKDAATAAAIDRLAVSSRNYPVEWTRLIALYLHEAHFGLAEGNKDAARRIVAFHHQLRALLDDDARRGPLGNVLLSRGKYLLDQAMLNWTNIESGDSDVYQDLVDGGLAEWGTVSGPKLPPVQKGDALASWLGAKTQGLLVSGGNPLRALDVLGLCLPDDNLQGVVGLLRPDGTTQEIVVAYGPSSQDSVHDPRHITYWLDEQLATTSKSAAPYTAQACLTFPSATVGPVVSIVPQTWGETSPADGVGEPVKLPHDFGIVNIDRTFEQNRRLFAFNKGGSRFTVDDAAALAKLKVPFTGQSIKRASLARDGKNDLVGELQWTFAQGDGKNVTLIDLASPIWQRLGASTVTIVRGQNRPDSVDLTWKDAFTQLCLSIPNQDNQPATVAVRPASDKDLAQRLEAAKRLDAAERKQRWSELKANTPLKRSFERIELGVSRAELAKRLALDNALRHEVGSTDLYTFATVAEDENGEWALRQAVARFDANNRLVEARLRYCDRPGSKAGGVFKFPEMVRNKSGAPEVVDPQSVPGSDPKSPAKVWRWLDDATLLQATSDRDGVELIMKDCPLESPEGRTLPPLYFLPRGPSHCLLGTTRESLFKFWRVKTPTVVGDAVYLRPDESSPYDALLVWMEGERVSKVVARHRISAEPTNSPIEAGRAVADAWGRQAQVFGWPVQQEIAQRKGNIFAWSNYDECTQVRIFWQDSEGSLRVFSEWK